MQIRVENKKVVSLLLADDSNMCLSGKNPGDLIKTMKKL